jgi:predicted DNA-binding protein
MEARLEKAFGYQGNNMDLPVPDLESAIPFYETVLGFRVLSRSDKPHRSAVRQMVSKKKPPISPSKNMATPPGESSTSSLRTAFVTGLASARQISGIANLSTSSYHSVVKGITIKLPEETLRRLQEEARATGRTVASLIRERVEAHASGEVKSVYALTRDLCGTVEGSRASATNSRRKFRRS